MSIFIIAEIGINHNGDLSICKELIDTAKFAGCNAVKFQKRDINQVYTKEFLDSPRKSPWGSTQREQKNGIEFNEKDYLEIEKYCKKKEIDWFVSSWDLNSQFLMRKFNFKYNKIASPMIVNTDFLEEVASERKHTFISTGMCELSDIDKAVEIFRKNNCPFELMHCVSTYPMRDEDANLKMIETLRNRYKCNIGYSGHESGIAVSYAAAALNISSLERHITLDRSMWGTDQSASLEPRGLKTLVRDIRIIEQSLGDGIKKVYPSEKKIKKKLRI